MITVYDSVGRIQYTVDAPYPSEIIPLYDDLATADPDFNYTEVPQTDIINKYIDLDGTPTIEDRPEMVALDYDISGVNIYLLGLPNNSTINVDGGAFTDTNGTSDEYVLDAGDSGTYTIQVSCWPYLDATFEVIVL